MSYRKLKVSSLNTHGVRGNLIYINKLCNENDIVFICEHWLQQSEEILLESISNKKQIIFNSSMEEGQRKGRPFGGLCWFIDDKLKIISYEFISNFISIIKILIDGNALNIIGVYCIYNNNTSDHKKIFENQISVIESLCNQYNDEKVDYILVGDFNADPIRRKYSCDKMLNEIINDNELISTIVKDNNIHHFTYSNENSNSIIDHILIPKKLLDAFSIGKIEYDSTNTSDHNAVSAVFLLLIKNTFQSETNIKENKKYKSTYQLVFYTCC